jgi:PAS domain S-box-containing protein
MNDLAFLQQSFDHFNQATANLQRAYASLEEKFASINRELEEKNIELTRTIAEKEDMKNYLQNILESLMSGVVVTDMQEKIQTVNRCAETFFDVPQSSVLGTQVAALFGDAFPEKEGAIRFSEYFQGETGRKIRLKGKTMEVFGAPVKDRNGADIGTVFIMRDVTRIEKLEEMAKRTEKFAAMGEMAANIAHEIRNPLGSIELFASLLGKDLTEKRDRDRLAQIISSVKNMDNKISNLLLFTRNSKPMMRKVNLHDILKEIQTFSEQIFAQGNIVFSLRYAAPAAVVDGDAEMLKQVFFNLILNALQAMPEGGRLSIETRCSPQSGNGRADAAPGVEIRFSDDGVGIAAENRGRIFDPFFSTREGGSGLGLAIVHNIIDMHGGAINVEQGERGGAIFTVLLPLPRGEE